MDDKTRCPKCAKKEVFKHELRDSTTFYCQNTKCKNVWKDETTYRDMRYTTVLHFKEM